VVADVDHLHVKRIHLMSFSYIVIENMVGAQSDFCLVLSIMEIWRSAKQKLYSVVVVPIDYGNMSDCKTETLWRDDVTPLRVGFIVDGHLDSGWGGGGVSEVKWWWSRGSMGGAGWRSQGGARRRPNRLTLAVVAMSHN
jgi:hypothetical protein